MRRVLRGNMYLVKHMLPVKLRENYMTNVGEVLDLVYKEDSNFVCRKDGEWKFSNIYGESNMHSLFHFKMSEQLKQAIFKTLPKEEMKIPPSSFTINKYLPGAYLPKHRDSAGSYWKFHLIFLTCDQPHLKVYNEQGEGFLVEEKPGALCEMPIDILHEVTEIGKDERPKYSLVLAWGLR